MKNSKLTLVGIFTLLLTMGLNFNHSLNDYSIKATKLFAAGTSSSTTSTTATNINIKQCRPNVLCNGVWKGTANLEGCIEIFHNFKKCGFAIKGDITYQYVGIKEHCTGGNTWHDCEACQSDCVPTETSN
ncbi:hypothetical protein [Parabacteroides sp. AM08-6]|uniref:hypothetical protein n=1 Tax=Parabacteroides sp. AM08-6 TaxID=2292053 RepID=UPI000EFF573B|nr:hypothetical protein [Parabacteroides sp. AM08-6]RHJ84853.1 hypothetical protein DW103_05240 [Parabacteroides sp. AM08-6]